MNSIGKKILLSTSFFFFLGIVVLAQSGIYVGGHFRRERTVTVPTLKESGFTYVILFNVNVEQDGSLTMDGDTLCAGGVYKFASKHPYYIDDVTALRTGNSSVRRVESCIGGWNNYSYDKIKNLVKAQGTGTSSILYKNFKALKDAIPLMEAFNNDDEHIYDVETASKFHIMLYDLGFKTTIAPYTRKSFWQSFVNEMNTQRPGAIDRIDLQCYDGGAGNLGNPDGWKMGGITMNAGLLSYMEGGSTAIRNQMATWKSNSSVKGGFLWVYNDNTFNLKTYAKTITDVFGGGAVVRQGKFFPAVTVYSKTGFNGVSSGFDIGDFSNYTIDVHGFKTDSLTSLKVGKGYKIELFAKDNCTGESLVLTSDTSELTVLPNGKPVVSWKISANGVLSLENKTYYIKNKKSGLYLTPETENITEGVNLRQQPFRNDEVQQWKLGNWSNGVYNLLNVSTRKSIHVKNLDYEKDQELELSTYRQVDNQRNIIIPGSESGFYKITPQHSSKYISVETGKELDAGAAIVLSNSYDDMSNDWELVDVSAMDLPGNRLENEISVFPNPVSETLFVNISNRNVAEITITDLQGRRMMTENNFNGSIRVADLERGVYLLHLRFTDNVNIPYTCKFVKK